MNNQVPDVKPGIATTEFWLSLLPHVPVILACFGIGATGPIGIIVGGVCSAVYTLTRANVKGKALDVAAAAVQGAADGVSKAAQ